MSTTPDAVTAILRELFAINRTSRHLLGDAPLPGLTLATASVLGLLAERADRRAGDVADELGIDASAVSRKVADLERLGLVRRRPDPDDGRAWLLTLTDEGRGALDALRERYLAAVTASLRAWSDDELAALAASLGRLHADLTPDRCRSERGPRTPRFIDITHGHRPQESYA